MKKQKKKRYRQHQKEKWYKPKINTNIYITNLPPNIDEAQFLKFFSKAGIIRLDPKTLQPKYKIYKDKKSNKLKGDGLVSYNKEESVELAIQLLNDREISPGYRVKIAPAEF